MIAITKIRDVVQNAGCDWQCLQQSASQIVLFGSRACHVNSDLSDYDLLMVGSGARLKNRNLDLMWISEKEFLREEWQTSELGSHIGKYGVWLKGNGKSRFDAKPGSIALANKKRRVEKALRLFVENWRLLTAGYRRIEFLRFRRELQRLELLKHSFAIPPTPVLDKAWSSDCVFLRRLLAEVEVPNEMKEELLENATRIREIRR